MESLPGMRNRGQLAIAVFLLPLLMAVFSDPLGVSISSRDDLNYLAELADRPTFAMTLDPLSWMVLSLGSMITGLTSMGLRVIGLVVAAMTIFVLIRRDKHLHMVTLFVVSLFPLYIVIYFSQLRLAIAVAIFTLIVTSKHMHKLAIPVSALAHSSFLMLLYPPLVLMIPFGLDLVDQLEPDSVAAVKLYSYLSSELTQMPWYFGWELGLIAGFLGWQKKWYLLLEILFFAIAARLLSDNISLDVGRRVLELGILAYSPFFLLVLRKIKPSTSLICCFIMLGSFQTAVSLYSGVITF